MMTVLLRDRSFFKFRGHVASVLMSWVLAGVKMGRLERRR